MILAHATFLANHEHIGTVTIFSEVAGIGKRIEYRESLSGNAERTWAIHLAKHIHLEVSKLHAHLRIFHILANLLLEHSLYFIGRFPYHFQLAEHREVDVALLIHKVSLELRGR